MDLTKYISRLGAMSLDEAYVNDTISIINADFHVAPSYRKIKINGIDDECTFKLTKDSTKRQILLRPQKTINKGAYVSLDGMTFMVTNFTPNEIYPKAEIVLCNNTLRWRDDFNSLKEYSCIIKGDSVNIDDEITANHRLVVMSEAELTVSVQYNEDTRRIKPNKRFLFDDQAYYVTGIDRVSEVYNGNGIVKLTIKSTSSSNTDNQNDDGVADSSGNSGWEGGW